jgi:hypothetical protein
VTEGTEASDDLKRQIVEQFRVIGKRQVVSISIIYSSEVSGGYRETDKVDQLLGAGYYEEILCGVTFRVSPFAFF